MGESKSKSIKSNLWVKIGIIVIISLLLMVPVGSISELIRERNNYAITAKEEVSSKWSSNQVIGAIVLSVPVTFREPRINSKGKPYYDKLNSRLFFFPEKLKMVADTKSIIRNRDIYKVPLYETKVRISGTFKNINASGFNIDSTAVHWDKANLALGVSDIRGLKSMSIKWDKKEIEHDVGDMKSKIFRTSINAKVLPGKRLKEKGKGTFSMELVLKGSEYLEFYPTAETTAVSVNSNWGTPSFFGAFLPEQREIGDENFNAEWNIIGMTRNLPKRWIGSYDLGNLLRASRFGVDFKVPLENYQLNTRSVKYSFLFVALTFITMFFLEVLFTLRFHPLHYVMTGAGLVLFYLLLLSFSEHVGFARSYGIASLATVSSISLYVWGVTAIKRGTLVVFSQLSILYGFLFVLLQESDYALVYGSTGLWLILAFLMYITRKIDWFNLSFIDQQQRGAAKC